MLLASIGLQALDLAEELSSYVRLWTFVYEKYVKYVEV